MHHVCKKETGMHQEVLGAYVKTTTELRETFEGKMDRVQGCCMQNVPEVIVIEDDNGDSEVENYESEAPLRRSQSHYDSSSSSGDSDSKSSYDTYELSANTSDEEDCVVIEPHASTFSKQKFTRAGKRLRPSADRKNESSRKRRSSPSDLSDCEIVLDFDGTVKQNWEEAALRRRTGKARRAESEESTSASVHANSDGRKSPKGQGRGDLQYQVKRSWRQAFGAGPSSHAKERKEDIVLDQQDSNVNVSDIGSDGIAEEALSPQNILKSVKLDTSGGNVDATKRLDTELHLKLKKCVETNGTLTAADKVVTDRETLKKTEEYLHAEEEEWARRHLELQKQAEKAQREKKKRKLELERRMEMEARQKRRLEEIRQSQLKENTVL
ncbi:hypothetical protein GOP47_0021069 [Adiantum capillus-veneris]|uniref:Uncharacterized protein n=1 Tax=Adiantum capillus-veneris TaxID=13818 RepID=A0A9D4UAD6_ADICA|nr:hypothetical protein GOP47_0021069 [Adiantum capillus-veneris]